MDKANSRNDKSRRLANEFINELEMQVTKRCAKATNVVNEIKRGDIILNWFNNPVAYSKVLSKDALLGLGTIIFDTLNAYINKRSQPILHDGGELTFAHQGDSLYLGTQTGNYRIECGNITAQTLYELVNHIIDDRIANNLESYHSSFVKGAMDVALLDAIEDCCIIDSEHRHLKALSMDGSDKYAFKTILTKYAELESELTADELNELKVVIFGILADAVYEFYIVGLQLYGINKEAFESMIVEDDNVLVDFVLDQANHPTLPTITLRWVNSFNGALKFDFNPAIYEAQSGRKSARNNEFDQYCRSIFDRLMSEIFIEWKV